MAERKSKANGYAVVRRLACDEYHAHTAECMELVVNPVWHIIDTGNQRAIVSVHSTKAEAEAVKEAADEEAD